jgi:Transcriptional activator of glycolytic enzymes
MNEQGIVLGALVQGQGGNVLETVAAIHHHVAAIQREQFEIKAELELFRKEEWVTNRVLTMAIQRMSRQPGRILGQARVVQEPVQVENDDENADALRGPPATLSKNPKTLHSLWQEFEEGLGGRKPAKMFTARERGRVKQMYYRRKVVWDTVALLIRAGYTAQTAIDQIYETYRADQSVTNVIRVMLRDRQGGGHPNLRVGRAN